MKKDNIEFGTKYRYDESDSKWTVKSNYGTNGRFVMDNSGIKDLPSWYK